MYQLACGEKIRVCVMKIGVPAPPKGSDTVDGITAFASRQLHIIFQHSLSAPFLHTFPAMVNGSNCIGSFRNH